MIYYYKVAFLKSPLEPLTYQSDIKLDIGRKVEVKLARRKLLTKAVILQEVSKPTFKCTNITNITIYFYDNMMLQTAKFISSYYVCSIGEALNLYTPFSDEFIKQSYNNSSKLDINIDFQLSTKQQKLFDFTLQHKASLLFAATGSGKTEIYIKAIEKVLTEGKQAVLLMPEISLTPQMEKRLQKSFGSLIEIWHSKVTKKRKNQILNNLANGTTKIIAGARSSLFLPYDNLGLIIVDEEHDESYKANNKPRINTKDLSLYISKKFDIQVILGSATPSLSSYTKIPYIRNKETFFKTNKSYTYDNNSLGLNDKILDKISQTLQNKQQIIVFLPTRANFKYQICSDCGKSVECPFCSVGLSLHKNNKALKCHYCNYTQPITPKCPHCHTGMIKNFRLGTAEVEQLLKEYFQEATIQRFDTDIIKTNKQLKDILKKFNDNKIDILVGTQMLSKGHDYHNVTLAIILGIDSVLNMTSYKSREQALSLALQIAGRSGRKNAGEVLIQTKNQDFFQKYLENNNYEEFLDEELEYRQNLYPPSVRLARVVFAHQNHQIAQNELNKYLQFCQNSTANVEIVGFGESNIFKIANKYRYELLFRSQDTKALLNILHTINSPIASIDMDSLY